MSELITGYTNEGEAIITLQEKVDSLTDSYKEAIKAQTFSAKAGKVALQALATVGNMLVAWGISKIFAYRKRATNGSYLITLFVYVNDTPVY